MLVAGDTGRITAVDVVGKKSEVYFEANSEAAVSILDLTVSPSFVFAANANAPEHTLQ